MPNDAQPARAVLGHAAPNYTAAEDAAMLAGAEVEHGASEPDTGHHPRTEPASAQEKQVLDAAIRRTEHGMDDHNG